MSANNIPNMNNYPVNMQPQGLQPQNVQQVVVPVPMQPNLGQVSQDTVEITQTKQPPKIGFLRLATCYLSDDQIKAVNECGRLPSNAKIYPPYNQIRPNFFNIRQGTSKIPEGYELRRNVLGFTVVVPKETEGLLIRSVR